MTFRGCRLDLAGFRFARLQRVAFEDCVLREADFAERTLPVGALRAAAT